MRSQLFTICFRTLDLSPVELRNSLLPSHSKELPVRMVGTFFYWTQAKTHTRTHAELSVYFWLPPYTQFVKMAKVCCVCSEPKETSENRLFRCGGQGCGIIVHQGISGNSSNVVRIVVSMTEPTFSDIVWARKCILLLGFLRII